MDSFLDLELSTPLTVWHLHSVNSSVQLRTITLMQLSKLQSMSQLKCFTLRLVLCISLVEIPEFLPYKHPQVGFEPGTFWAIQVEFGLTQPPRLDYYFLKSELILTIKKKSFNFLKFLDNVWFKCCVALTNNVSNFNKFEWFIWSLHFNIVNIKRRSRYNYSV